MAIAVDDLAGVGMVRERMSAGLRAEVFEDLAGVEALWRGLESDPAVLATPYQRFDWVAAYLRAEPAAALRIIVLRDAAGRGRMILPLTVARERGAAVARVVGAKHANYHMPLFASREAAAMPGEDLREALRLVGGSAGIDVYALSHQPRFWDGAANPLALRAEPSPSDAYGLMLGPDPDSTMKRVFSADARKKLRAKERKLVEGFGTIEHRVAATPEEATAYLQAFYAQKAVRFAQMGVADPYAEAGVRDFLSAGAAGENSAIEVHALVAVETGRVLATFGGAVDTQRFSGMMTAFDGDPAASRWSPGDVLLHHLIRDQAVRGRRGFDLGVGEARYKASICDETIELAEVAIPVTLRGTVFAMQAIGLSRLKRRIKRDPRLWAVIQRLRRWSARGAPAA
ncbi:GNAT family N-acetyltransferase [Methylobacterium iners]|uniref:BioF2-like acetyltransferase domain-containing protein n=1 Tax=Methylobacterium iners TaxID=418707 RepID=A0ABQ4S2Q9_9HYPH|nr:hypothetical protein OCOJLMKI_4648 [Methylobacterium iners]